MREVKPPSAAELAFVPRVGPTLRVGDIVKLVTKDPRTVKFGQGTDLPEGFREGQLFRIKEVEIHSWHTLIWVYRLEDAQVHPSFGGEPSGPSFGPFNEACFTHTFVRKYSIAWVEGHHVSADGVLFASDEEAKEAAKVGDAPDNTADENEPSEIEILNPYWERRPELDEDEPSNVMGKPEEPS